MDEADNRSPDQHAPPVPGHYNPQHVPPVPGHYNPQHAPLVPGHYNLGDFFPTMPEVGGFETDPRLKFAPERWEYIRSMPQIPDSDARGRLQLLQLLLLYYDDLDTLVADNPRYAFLLRHDRPSWMSYTSGKDLPAANTAPGANDDSSLATQADEQNSESGSPETEGERRATCSCFGRSSRASASRKDSKSLDCRVKKRPKQNDGSGSWGRRRKVKRRRRSWSDMYRQAAVEPPTELPNVDYTFFAEDACDEEARVDCNPACAKSPGRKPMASPDSGRQIPKRKVQGDGVVPQVVLESLSSMTVGDFVNLWHKADRLHKERLVSVNTHFMEAEEYLAAIHDLPESDPPEERKKPVSCRTVQIPPPAVMELQKSPCVTLEPQKEISTKKHGAQLQVTDEPSLYTEIENIQTQAEAGSHVSKAKAFEEVRPILRAPRLPRQNPIVRDHNLRPNSAFQPELPLIRTKLQMTDEVAAVSLRSPNAVPVYAKPMRARKPAKPSCPTKPQRPRGPPPSPPRQPAFGKEQRAALEPVPTPTVVCLRKRPPPPQQEEDLPGYSTLMERRARPLSSFKPKLVPNEKPHHCETPSQPSASMWKETPTAPLAELEKDFGEMKPQVPRRLADMFPPPPTDDDIYLQPMSEFEWRKTSPPAMTVPHCQPPTMGVRADQLKSATHSNIFPPPPTDDELYIKPMSEFEWRKTSPPGTTVPNCKPPTMGVRAAQLKSAAHSDIFPPPPTDDELYIKPISEFERRKTSPQGMTVPHCQLTMGIQTAQLKSAAHLDMFPPPPADDEICLQPLPESEWRKTSPQGMTVIPRQPTMGIRAAQLKSAARSTEACVRTKPQPPSKREALRRLSLLAAADTLQIRPLVQPAGNFVELAPSPHLNAAHCPHQLPCAMENDWSAKPAVGSSETSSTELIRTPPKQHQSTAGLFCQCPDATAAVERTETKCDVDSNVACVRPNQRPTQTAAVWPGKPQDASDKTKTTRSSMQCSTPFEDKKVDQQGSVVSAAPKPAWDAAKGKKQPESSRRTVTPMTSASSRNVPILSKQFAQAANREIPQKLSPAFPVKPQLLKKPSPARLVAGSRANCASAVGGLQPLSPAFPVKSLLFKKPPPARVVAGSRANRASAVGRQQQPAAGSKIRLPHASGNPQGSRTLGGQSCRASASCIAASQPCNLDPSCPYKVTVRAQLGQGSREDLRGNHSVPVYAKPCKKKRSLGSRLYNFLFKQG